MSAPINLSETVDYPRLSRTGCAIQDALKEVPHRERFMPVLSALCLHVCSYPPGERAALMQEVIDALPLVLASTERAMRSALTDWHRQGH